MVCLCYLVKDDFQSECADLDGVSQPTVSRVIGSVLLALNGHLNNVKFPTSNEKIIHIKSQFFKLAKFPGVIGAVDGTLIPILAPKVDEFAYVCRKGYHVLDVQGVVDASLRFMLIGALICSLSLFAWVYYLIEFGRLKFIHEIYHIYLYIFRFTNYVCKWPGSVHDSFIFRESQLHDLFKNQKIGWLLGGSGYALQPQRVLHRLRQK